MWWFSALAVILLIILGVVGVMVTPIYSQDEAEETEEEVALIPVSAEIVSVDLKKSNIVIKILKDPVSKTYEKQTISVLPDETVIQKDDIDLALSDLKLGDKVKVNYTTDSSGQYTAESIIVETASTK